MLAVTGTGGAGSVLTREPAGTGAHGVALLPARVSSC
jgi:hypothetical protein